MKISRAENSLDNFEVSCMDTNPAIPNEKKKIFEPESIEQLLQGWLLHAHKGRNRHDLAARRYDRLRIWLGGTAAVISAVVATSASFSAALADILTVKIVMSVFGTLSAILISLSTFLNLSERAEKHRSTAVRYKETIWEIEKVLSGSSVKTLTGEEQPVLAIQKSMKELETIAPVVSERIYKQVEREWQSNGIAFVSTAAGLLE